ncbi:uncharacterized protein PHACADRAFT_212537 [Phanerochaete carnosa HHB-10118-sp]|uniref:AB hydrolase-1 domain-containing protein n=1 Tax=Phanerochaete carnosa (strain HHB-10118-sp) TaxID=650164 RepID=K5VYN1_PHACS|nr:uncharacterized protein PHACADRAFT_212537 [Phanerochaete carnosa HHB-10118-sp]EKM51920.1 hypothetical protein PHACADRAFT_212537 [Phanerochaete carnosa HHB-10118-sp]
MPQTPQTLSVDDHGTNLAYFDSGVPSYASPSGSRYTTIFAIHGMTFCSPVFEKMASVSGPAGVRWVSIQRRDYPGSTPFSKAELNVLKSGTDEEKAQHVRDRGVEIATFIDKFVQQNGLPPPDEKGNGGGFAVMGWSLGALYALATAANVDALGDAERARFAQYMRSLILLDAAYGAIGLLPPPKMWNPFLDESIPPRRRAPMFNYWVTAYFDHGDLNNRDFNTLEYVVPSPTRIPSIHNLSAEQRAAIIYNDCVRTSDGPLTFCVPQLRESYEKAIFDKKTREILPNMKVWALFGDRTSTFSLPTMFTMEEDDKAYGGGNVRFRFIKGANHVMHWDEPELTLEALLDAMA